MILLKDIYCLTTSVINATNTDQQHLINCAKKTIIMLLKFVKKIWKPKRSVLMPFMIKNMPKCRISQLRLSLYEALVSPILPPAPPYPATSLPINPRKL